MAKETKTIKNVECSIHGTKLDGEFVGNAFVPILDETDFVGSVQALVDEGWWNDAQCVKWLRAGCAIALQAEIRSYAKDSISDDALLERYWTQTRDCKSKTAALAKAKELWTNELDNDKEPTNVAPFGIVRDA